MDILNANSFLFFLIFFVPGFVSMKVYDLLVAGDKRDFSKSTLEVFAYGAINLALLFPLIWLVLYYRLYNTHPMLFAVFTTLVLLVMPIFWPWVYVKKVVVHPKLARLIVSPNKRPWDFFFSKKEEAWVIVTLKNGRKIGGIYSGNSFASSFPLPEQIYLEKIWKLNKAGEFIEPIERSKGVIIIKDILTVEFFTD
jgi:hypothetical protein